MDMGDSLTATLTGLIRGIVAEEVDRQLAERQTAPEWLTLEQAAELRHTTHGALRKRAQRGQLPGAVRDGARWLVDRRVLESSPDRSTVRADLQTGGHRGNGPAPAQEE
jgi:hypothetical protein